MLSVAHGTAFELVSIAVDVGAVVGYAALSDTPLQSAGHDVNVSRVVIRMMLSVPTHDSSILTQHIVRSMTAQVYYFCVHRPSSSSGVFHAYSVVWMQCHQ